MEYRCTWVAPTGKTGHGEWTTDKSAAQAAVDLGSKKFPEIKHTLETKE